ncbi:MAG TPA: 3'(2'),5'-bisphosphate nucleotidase CysQ, partial [Leptospiraceae bacterium]|nr:3'(2'),5'-bisphosphate nucleotidase CysQ [Leptospiraceae bacterium]
ISSVLEAGKIVRSIYDTNFEVSWKAKDDPLTEADLRANQEIIRQIQLTFPEDAILSEEISDSEKRLSKERVWIIDPIDGTREFVKKNPEFSVSLGLSVSGKAFIGSILNPITRELFVGIVGQGIAYLVLKDDFSLDLNQLNLTKHDFKPMDSKPFTYVSRSEFFKYKLFDQNPYWKENYDLKPVGSIAYKLALAAANLGDLALSLKPKSEWDICGGVALIEASGGIAVDLKNQKAFPFNEKSPLQHGILAGNPFLVEKILKEKGNFFRDSLVNWE